MNEELIRDIQSTRFQPVRLREGYDMADIDRFLDDLCARAAAGVATPADIDDARFRPVRLREGYDMGQVDEALDRFRQRLVASHTPGTATNPAPAAAAPAAAVPVPSVIQEVDGSGMKRLLKRLFGR